MSTRAIRDALALALSVALQACVTQDDARVQQLLNQRGFGSRYVGDSNEQYYLGIGDSISVQDQQHPEFDEILTVRPDGVIDPMNIDEVFVAGLTLPDVQETLTRRYREYNSTAQLDVQLMLARSKFFYVDGEVAIPGRHPFVGDTSLFQVVFESRPTLLADEDAIELIRADPVHPLVVKFDYDDMKEGGWSRANVEVRENDIVYVPPNLFGYLTRFIAIIVTPLNVIVYSVLDVNRLVYVVDSFGSTNRYGGYNRGRRGGGGYYTAAPMRQPFVMQVAPIDPGLGDG